MDLRNIAIIAHVDHGKTTLVDKLLHQSGTFRENQKIPDQVMDSNELERERGITILAKATSVYWKGIRINIVDTPGHADFGGEVERILSMVDGAIVLVDAAEGPMPQTKFVLMKALKRGLKPIVFINKVDKPEQRAHEVHNEVFDLFALLDATEEQLDFPTLFGSAKQGWAATSPEGPKDSMEPLFEAIRKRVPRPPVADPDGPFTMLSTILEYDNYLGRLLTGRIESGRIRPNQQIKAISRDGTLLEEARVMKVLAFRGIERQPIDEGVAGDIVAVAGLSEASVSDTLCDLSVTAPIPAQAIDPATLSMTVSVNDSPLCGQEGTKVTSRLIWDRLRREAEGNVAIKVSQSEAKDAFEVSGRGELQLGVLIEQMRREGFEMSVGRPRVIFKTDERGQRLEPIEEVVIDVDDAYAGVVVEKIGQRRGELKEMRPSGGGKTRLAFLAPSRALIGYHGEFMTDTRGTGIMNKLFHSYAPYKGAIQGRRNGVLVSLEQGKSVAYALWYLEERGPMFIDSGVPVYAGMIIGENSRGNDLDVNPLKTKQLTNVRASGKDENVLLTPPIKMTLEKAIAYIEDDELVEVTPKSIRLRKRWLDIHERKRHAKRAEVA
ncbi:MAG: translational GTPase TypA [Candidatus Odyssella sp.]|nr:translational GTPase TypA [Candidatus Odyssella sp.]